MLLDFSDSEINLLSTTAQLGSRTCPSSPLAVRSRSCTIQTYKDVKLPHGFSSRIGILLSSFKGIIEDDDAPSPGIDLSELSSMEPSTVDQRDESFSNACQMHLLAKQRNLCVDKSITFEPRAFEVPCISQIRGTKRLQKNELSHQRGMQDLTGSPWPDIVRGKSINGVKRVKNRLL